MNACGGLEEIISEFERVKCADGQHSAVRRVSRFYRQKVERGSTASGKRGESERNQLDVRRGTEPQVKKAAREEEEYDDAGEESEQNRYRRDLQESATAEAAAFYSKDSEANQNLAIGHPNFSRLPDFLSIARMQVFYTETAVSSFSRN